MSKPTFNYAQAARKGSSSVNASAAPSPPPGSPAPSQEKQADAPKEAPSSNAAEAVNGNGTAPAAAAQQSGNAPSSTPAPQQAPETPAKACKHLPKDCFTKASQERMKSDRSMTSSLPWQPCSCRTYAGQHPCDRQQCKYWCIQEDAQQILSEKAASIATASSDFSVQRSCRTGTCSGGEHCCCFSTCHAPTTTTTSSTSFATHGQVGIYF